MAKLVSIDSEGCCVAPETPVLTKNGYFPIQSLEGQTVSIWNGSNWVDVVVRNTAPLRHFITIVFSNGRTLTCTIDHKFIVGDGPLKEAKRLYAINLVRGTKLHQSDNRPLVDGSEPFPNAYMHGALCAAGCFTEKGPILDLPMSHAKHIFECANITITPDTKFNFPENMPVAYSVPINSSISTKIDWLKGFVWVRSFPVKRGIYFASVNRDLLLNMQLLLSTLGVNSILNRDEEVDIPLPDSNTLTIANYILSLSWTEFNILLKLGLTCPYTINTEPEEISNDLQVAHVIDVGRLSPSYCFVESDNNAAMFNGVLTGTMN